MDELPADRFFDFGEISELAVGPDGDRIAFVLDEFDPEEDERRRSLFVVPADGSRDPHRLTRASDASTPKWSPDGSKLGFVAARDEDVELAVGTSDDETDDEEDETAAGDGEETGTGGEGPTPQLWVFDVARGGDARQITDRDEGVEGFDWGPDGARVVIESRDPTEEQAEYLRERRDENGPIEVDRLQHKADGRGWLDDVTPYLFVVDLDTREERRLDDASGAGARLPLFGMQPRWGPTDRIAFLSNDTDNPDDSGVLDLFTIDPDGGNRRRLTDGTRRVSGARWSPSGDRIAIQSSHPRNLYVPTEINVLDVETGETRSISASLDRTVAWAGTAEWTDGDTLLAPMADEGQARLVRFDANRDAPERVFDGLGSARGIELFDHGGGTIGLSIGDPTEGTDLYALDADAVDAATDDPLVRLTSVNEDLVDEYPMPEVERVTYENDDGETIEAIVYLPPDLDEPAPTIASIHGGPMSYDQPTFAFRLPYWTSRGYVVFKPNYRGSTSYGRAFSETLRGSRGTLETDDVTSGIEHLADRGLVDPERTFITGFSYGGITTAHAITRTDAFAAAAAEHGIYDFHSVFGTDDNHLWHEDEFGLPWEDPDTFRDISSITDVDDIETPLLLTAGENDWRCPPTQAEQLYVSVKKRGVPSKLVVYPDEHHNIGDPERAIHRLETLAEWFETHDPGTGN
ncbi:MAG TPA: S9 family peptidase [Natrialbaceae archaeon]|nr:S9 family peptidase [Natrialbaceae archaeon]